MELSVYFDPVCPWCWVTARWLFEVRHHRPLEIQWKSFSLDIKNAGTERSEGMLALHHEGRKALRMVEAVRAQLGEAPVESLYLAMGRHFHHERNRTFDLVATSREVGVDETFAKAGEQAKWDIPVEHSMEAAAAATGEDVGVPLIVNDQGVGFFGPILSPAPTGPAAAELFDHLVGLFRFEGFFELKRDRTGPPILGEFL